MWDPDGRVAVIAGNVRVDAATAEVTRALDAAGVGNVLLKGPSIGRWLYSTEDPRPYLDCDLLVEPGGEERAANALMALGFVRRFDDRDLPDWWREHAVAWRRSGDGVTVDVHRVIKGVGVDAHDAWPILTASSTTITVAGHPARVLGLPARALLLALHAAHHGPAFARPLIDLERGLALDEELWRRALALAERIDAVPGLALGLGMLPEGRDLVERLGLTASPSREAWLRAHTAPPVALGLDQLARARGIRARLAIVWAKVVPPPSFIRHWRPVAARSRRDLVLAYLYRPVWIARRTPRAAAAWRRARRATRQRP